MFCLHGAKTSHVPTSISQKTSIHSHSVSSLALEEYIFPDLSQSVKNVTTAIQLLLVLIVKVEIPDIYTWGNMQCAINSKSAMDDDFIKVP